ncbi:MAG: penicillin-binding protein activator [Candidatus Paceibacterota bacterium]
MNKTTKTIIWVVVIALVIWGIVAISNNNQVSLDSPVKIGFMTDLSGPAAPYGNEIERGARLALNEINNSNLEVLFDDTQCSGPTGISVFNKFTNVDGINVTGGTVCSNVALSIAPIAENNQIIHLSTGASSPVLSDAGDYIFRLWPSDDLEASILANYGLDELTLESASILYVNTEFGVALRDAFSEVFSDNGGNIIDIESFESDDTEFRTQLSKIKQNSPEAIYIVPNPEQVSLIVKQVNELEINSLVLSYGPPIEAEGVLESLDGFSGEIYYAHPNQQDSNSFIQRYEELYNTRPGLGASVGYDTLMILYEAIGFCGSDDSNCVRDYLYDLEEYRGASGTISIDENGDVFIPSIIKRFSGGIIETL